MTRELKLKHVVEAVERHAARKHEKPSMVFLSIEDHARLTKHASFTRTTTNARGVTRTSFYAADVEVIPDKAVQPGKVRLIP